MNFTQVGENAIAITVASNRTVECVRAIRSLYSRILQWNVPGIVSVRCGLDALLIEHEEKFDPDNLVQALQEVKPAWEIPPAGSLIRVPVCYEGDLGRDLSKVAERTGRTPEEVVGLHMSRFYEVWMIGFMPGFPYLGELPEALRMERKSIPDPNIPAGSVAIAEEYVGIYPFDSPGGWYVLGRTPWNIVDYSKPKPWLFECGMQVEFYPIAITDFEKLRA